MIAATMPPCLNDPRTAQNDEPIFQPKGMPVDPANSQWVQCFEYSTCPSLWFRFV